MNRLGGATPNPDDAPAGAYLGMTVAVPAVAVGAATLAPADAFYDLDSQALDGDFAAVRFHADSDGIRFPSGGAFRLVMCVRDTAESVSSPSLAAVRFETAQAAGGIVQADQYRLPFKANAVPDGGKIAAGPAWNWLSAN